MNLNFLFSLFFPNFCPICSSSLDLKNPILCFDCSVLFSNNIIDKNSSCNVCGSYFSDSNFRCVCNSLYENYSCYFFKNISCYFYNPFIKNLIQKIKFNNRFSLLNLFVDELLKYVDYFYNLFSNPLFIPMPISYYRKRYRGFNQSEILLQYLLLKEKFDHSFKLLKKIKNNDYQSVLNLSDRFNNPIGCYKVIDFGLLENRDIVIIDDIFTTGLTINECARVLLIGGAKSVSSITIASSSFVN